MGGERTDVGAPRPEPRVGEATTPTAPRDGRVLQEATPGVIAFAAERVLIAEARPPLA